MELEAKLSIPSDEVFQRLLAQPTLAGFTASEATVKQVYDRYLDTVDQALVGAGFACRLRATRDGSLITLKGLGGNSGALHQRAELEVELPQGASELDPASWPESDARQLALDLSQGQRLQPLFDLEQERHVRLLYVSASPARSQAGSESPIIELSLDRVRFDHGNSPVLELEAELLPDGEKHQLQRLLTFLVEENSGLQPQTQSKFERGLSQLRPDLGQGLRNR